MESKRFLKALPLVPLVGCTLALLVVSCAAPVEVKEQGSSMTDPFFSRSEDENGLVVEWSGFARGHQAGEGSAIKIVLHNGSQDVWQGSYCIQLLDPQSIVATLKQGEFSLQPGKEWGMQETIHFPDDLSDGDYGLALVIPGQLSIGATVQVGNETSAYGGTWPEPDCP
ncbi:MAG: hypothetical protein U9R58_04145 [Chloroflexota bacterium]|nr:hypothetical protein [Chloroflexota bacterium]